MKNYSEISVFLFIICGTMKLDSLASQVRGVFGHDVERVSVTEGDSVTLDIDFREEFDQIMWRFGDSGSIIAETDGNEISYPDDERFRDRLKLNHQTGSLTINNMTITDSGDYHLWINRILYKTFIVTVHVFGADEDGVKRVLLMEGDSVTLDTRLREKFKRILWWFAESYSFIAKIYGNEISYPLRYTERFRDRLKLNNQTGSLTIKNMRVTDSGVYRLQIDHSAGTSTVTFMVIVCGSSVSDPGLSPADVAAIVVVVLLLLVAAAVSAVLYYRRKISK